MPPHAKSSWSARFDDPDGPTVLRNWPDPASRRADEVAQAQRRGGRVSVIRRIRYGVWALALKHGFAPATSKPTARRMSLPAAERHAARTLNCCRPAWSRRSISSAVRLRKYRLAWPPTRAARGSRRVSRVPAKAQLQLRSSLIRPLTHRFIAVPYVRSRRFDRAPI